MWNFTAHSQNSRSLWIWCQQHFSVHWGQEHVYHPVASPLLFKIQVTEELSCCSLDTKMFLRSWDTLRNDCVPPFYSFTTHTLVQRRHLDTVLGHYENHLLISGNKWQLSILLWEEEAKFAVPSLFYIRIITACFQGERLKLKCAQIFLQLLTWAASM